MEEFEEKIRIMKEKFEKVIEMFKERTKKECYKIEVVDGTPDIMDNKIGGIPYLPIGEEYPKDKNGTPLALLLQVNLKDIDLEDYPKRVYWKFIWIKMLITLANILLNILKKD